MNKRKKLPNKTGPSPIFIYVISLIFLLTSIANGIVFYYWPNLGSVISSMTAFVAGLSILISFEEVLDS